MSSNPDDRIYFSKRGFVHIPLGGEDRLLRYRAMEIERLETLMGIGIMSMIDEEKMGMRFVKNSIIVGVAHSYAGKVGKKKKEKLTEKLVMGWVDKCDGEGSNISFDDLLNALLKAVLGGMPNGAKMVAEMEKAEAEAEAEARENAAAGGGDGSDVDTTSTLEAAVGERSTPTPALQGADPEAKVTVEIPGPMTAADRKLQRRIPRE